METVTIAPEDCKSTVTLRASVVTGLFDIGRASSVTGDGRAMAQYVSELRALCAQVQAPLHVFLDETLAADVESLRAVRPPGQGTFVHLLPLQALPTMRDAPAVEAANAAGQAAYKARIEGGATAATADAARAADDWLETPQCLEFINPRYVPLIMCKPWLVARAAADDATAQRQPPHAYIWADAGIQRYCAPPYVKGAAVALGAPSQRAIAQSLKYGAVLIAARANLPTYRGTPLQTGVGGGGLMATALIGPLAAWRALDAATLAAWRYGMVPRARFANEQNLWSDMVANGGGDAYIRAVRGYENWAAHPIVGEAWYAFYAFCFAVTARA